MGTICLAQAGGAAGGQGTFDAAQFEQQARQLLADMQKPDADPTQFQQQVGQLFQQFREQTAGMDPAQAQQIQQQLMQKLQPAFMAAMPLIAQRMQQRFLDNLKQDLGCTDEEFAAISPSIQKVIDAMTADNQRIGGMPRVRTPGQMQSAIQLAMMDLRGALDDDHAPANLIKTKLDALRQAKVKADDDLEQARNQLRMVLTVRQESVLVANGLLD
jgi:hypothetical protein